MMRCNNRQITKTHLISEFANCCAKQIFNFVHMKNKYTNANTKMDTDLICILMSSWSK